MRSERRPIPCVALFFLLSLVPALAQAEAPTFKRCPNYAEAVAGTPSTLAPFRGAQCLELELRSASNPAAGGVNPYRDFALTLSLSKPGTSAGTIAGVGFWDGGQVFRFRTALPAPEGTLTSQAWNWAASCKLIAGGALCPAALALSASGSLTINYYPRNSGAVEIYKKGFLRTVGQGTNRKPYLAYGDGTTPFFWLGDTAWEGPVKEALTQDAAQWTTFLGNRRQKGFTVVLVAPAPIYGNSNPVRGFTVSGSCSDPVPNSCSTPDFGYWRRFEALVEEANRQGLVVAVLGMIDPVDRGGLDKIFPESSNPYPRQGDAVRFAGYLAARLSGNHVVFSPGYDDKPADATFDGTPVSTVMHAVGAEIKRVAPRHLIANHLAGSAQDGDYQSFESAAWFSFHLFHSGHAFNASNACPTPGGLSRQQCAVKRARELALNFRRRNVASANGEGGYEFPSDPNALPPDNRYGARHTGYSSLGSGASGPTDGVKGIFDWTSPTGFLNSEGSRDFKRLGDRIRVRPWQNLKPMHNLILNNGGLPEQQKMVLAGTPDNTFVLAYLPNNKEIVIDTRMLAGLRCDAACPWSIRWFSAGDNTEFDGRSTSANGPACGDGTNRVTLTRPNCTLGDAAGIQGGCDWVIELRKIGCSQSANAAVAPPNNTLTVAARPGDETTPHAIVASLTDLAGNPLGGEIPVSLQEASFQKSPVSARDSAGNFWVVWQAQDLDGDGEGILARRYDEKGNALDEAFPVSGSFKGDQTDPSITADAVGRLVIVWTSHGQDGDLGGIFARRFDLKGQPLEDEFQVNTTTLGHQVFPQVMADTVGNFVVAWEGEDSDGDGRGVYSRLFDASGEPKGLETRANTTTAGDQALAALQVAPTGEITIDWIGYDTEGETTGVFRQLFQRDGIPVGGETLMAVPPPDES